MSAAGKQSLVGREQFEREVYPAELRAIRERRKVRGLPGLASPFAPRDDGRPFAPHADHGTAGLAFSGGGIRSATFCLGVLQVFAKRGLLRWFDYLSTVSGGGYIGSCLSATLQFEDPGAGPAGHSFIHQRGRDEPPLIQHLRSAGDYLAPSGLLDVLRIPAVLLRGMVVNLLVTLPFLALLALYTACLYPNLLNAELATTFFRFRLAPPEEPGQLNFFLFFPWAVLAFAAWVTLFPVLTTVVRRPGYRLRSLYESSFSVLLLALVGLPVIEAAPWILRTLDRFAEEFPSHHLLGGSAAGLIGLVPVLRSLLAAREEENGEPSRLAQALRGTAVLLVGPAILAALYLVLTRTLYTGPAGAHEADGLRMRWMLLAAASAFVFTRLFLDVNKSGMHRFYRDRLSKAYLVDPRDGSHPDRLRMSGLDVRHSGAPYHLVNSALNIQATHEPGLQGRGADFFLFSPEWGGSYATGYCSTRLLEREDPDLDLATAFAISGAAASPYMGTSSSRLRAFLLTLLNIRLDYWFPNPRRVAGSAARRGLERFIFRVGPIYLLMELLGLLNDRSKNVNLSDGGHIENLGLYELLRRRCRFIVCCDAGCDPRLELPSLGKLTAYARMDQGVRIRWTNLDRLKLRDDGTTETQWAMGKIDYGAAGEGWILYLKASLHGDEPPDVAAYMKKHPAFPHESTGDQFFDEAQFEAYRALGYEIGGRFFGDEQTEVGDLGEWFAEVEDKAQATTRET